jgi:hypothetical protein
VKFQDVDLVIADLNPGIGWIILKNLNTSDVKELHYRANLQSWDYTSSQIANFQRESRFQQIQNKTHSLEIYYKYV